MSAPPFSKTRLARRSGTDAVDSKLRKLIAAGTQTVRVFIVLRQQPQRDVLDRHEGPASLRLQILEGRYSDALRTAVSDTEVAAARDELDKVARELRQAAFAEIEASVQPAQQHLAQIVSQLGGRVIRRYTAINAIAASLPGAAVDLVAADPLVAEISLIERHSAQLATSSASLGADVLWSGGYTGRGESVAVMDTGVRTGHPAFSGLQIVSKAFLDEGKEDVCFDDDSSSGEDKQGHGTHVAGIVASRGASGWESYLGVAKGLGTLYNLKIGYRNCEGGGTGTTADVVSALEWAVRNAPGLKVFNYSFGGATLDDDDFSSRAFDYFIYTYGLTIAVAAGNESGSVLVWTRPGPVTSPGIAYNVVTVAAMNTQGTTDRSDDEVAIFSSQGPTVEGRKKPDVAAPGGLREEWDALRLGYVAKEGIYSADFDSDGFVAMPGTSMASPHVAGAAALLRQSGIREPLAIKALLLNTTGEEEWDEALAWGYANLGTASDQRDNVVTSSIAAGRTLLYKGSPNGAFYSTLAWNRSVDSEWEKGCLSNLDLSLYDGSGELLSSSNSEIDNVEKVYANTSGTVAVSIRHHSDDSCASSQKFALAFSTGGLELTSGVALNASCTASPSTVSPGTEFSTTCTITNTGDLPASSVQGTLRFTGNSSLSTLDFGTIAAGASSSKTWSVAAPSSTGSYTLELQAVSDSFGAGFSASANTSISVTNSACSISTSPTSFTVSANAGNRNVSVQTASGCSWNAVSNDSWISIQSGAEGTGDGTVTFHYQANGTSASRTGSISVGGQTVAVVQSATSAAPVAKAAVNGASYAEGIAAEEWVSVFGTELSSTTRKWRDDEIVNGVLPTELDGVRVKVNGKSAAISYISPTQINIQVPAGEDTGDALIEVTQDNAASSTTGRMQAFSPGLFLYDAEDRRYAAAQHSADYAIVGKQGLYDGSTPAKPGETIILYGTGFGSTDPATPTGRVVTQPAKLANPVKVTIGGVQASVGWAGISAASLYQFNVTVPDSLPDGDAAVLIEIEGFSTQNNVYLTVQR